MSPSAIFDSLICKNYWEFAFQYATILYVVTFESQIQLGFLLPLHACVVLRVLDLPT